MIVESASGIVITQNSIFGNGAPTGLGIDLDPRGVDPNDYMPAQGVTLNDPSDADAGPNGLLNFPVIEIGARQRRESHGHGLGAARAR